MQYVPCMHLCVVCLACTWLQAWMPSGIEDLPCLLLSLPKIKKNRVEYTSALWMRPRDYKTIDSPAKSNTHCTHIPEWKARMIPTACDGNDHGSMYLPSTTWWCTRCHAWMKNARMRNVSGISGMRCDERDCASNERGVMHDQDLRLIAIVSTWDRLQD